MIIAIFFSISQDLILSTWFLIEVILFLILILQAIVDIPIWLITKAYQNLCHFNLVEYLWHYNEVERLWHYKVVGCLRYYQVVNGFS